jgi:hypothetical protein
VADSGRLGSGKSLVQIANLKLSIADSGFGGIGAKLESPIRSFKSTV